MTDPNITNQTVENEATPVFDEADIQKNKTRPGWLTFSFSSP